LLANEEGQKPSVLKF